MPASAVADTYGDLRSGRPDAQPLSPLEARRTALAERGRQFDPAVVDAFASLFSAAPPQPTTPTLRLRAEDLRDGHT